ncbi:hypothetical protein [Catellatospora sp. TT07R-123]|uniref:hypothetical protein n=1 Tax=Catellatospora sp. TT07R-123 TaxID=2733863 RepID=UPI001BB3FBEF|nr:hypothetical protein [Catellatospora sp. TT07R-123]
MSFDTIRHRHAPIAIVVPRVIADDLLGVLEHCAEQFRDEALSCRCPGRDHDRPCADHQHDASQADMFRLAHDYVTAAVRNADQLATHPRRCGD